MPHTNRKPQTAPAWAPATFLNITLTKEDMAAIKALGLDVDKIDQSLASVMADGYKLTTKWDGRTNAYACWLVAPADGPNKGCILPGRGSTPLRAIRQALYIHFVILDRVWTGHDEISAGELDD